MNKSAKIIISFTCLLLISFFILSNNLIDKVSADEISEASVTTISDNTNNSTNTDTTNSANNTTSNENNNTGSSTTITTNQTPVSIVNYSNEVTESSDTYNYNTQLSDITTSQITTVEPTSTPDPTNNSTTTTDNNTVTTDNTNQNNTTSEILENTPSTLENITITKKIFIGDSRTVHMKLAVNSSDVWSCKSAMGLDWMKSTGVPNVENQITTGTAVIILMGVNDLFNSDKYITYINQKTSEWRNKGARVYFVSVNPINEKTYKSFKNTRIETFNNKMASNLVNVKYIDTYNYLMTHSCNFTSDGLHYQNSTSKVIYDLINKEAN